MLIKRWRRYFCLLTVAPFPQGLNRFGSFFLPNFEPVYTENDLVYSLFFIRIPISFHKVVASLPGVHTKTHTVKTDNIYILK